MAVKIVSAIYEFKPNAMHRSKTNLWNEESIHCLHCHSYSYLLLLFRSWFWASRCFIAYICTYCHVVFHSQRTQKILIPSYLRKFLFFLIFYFINIKEKNAREKENVCELLRQFQQKISHFFFCIVCWWFVALCWNSFNAIMKFLRFLFILFHDLHTLLYLWRKKS